MTKTENDFTFSSYVKQLETLPSLCKEIEFCLKHKMLFAALSLSLIIPSVLGDIEFKHLKSDKNEKGDAKRYSAWCDKHICYGLSEDPYITGHMIYKLRCKFFHTGRNKLPELFEKYNFILKYEENLNPNILSNDIYEIGEQKITMVIDVVSLCRRIVICCEKFLESDLYIKEPKFNVIDFEEIKQKQKGIDELNSLFSSNLFDPKRKKQ